MQNLTWQDFTNFFITLVIGYAVNVVSGKLDIPVWVALVVIFVGLITVFFITKSRKTVTLLGTYVQTILEGPIEEKANARKGLIVILSIYNLPGKPNSEELIAQAKDGVYSGMDFEKSNFAPVVRAIDINKTKISDCWILATDSADEDKPGSITFVPALINYLKNVRKISCEFHYDQPIRIDNDALITQKTRLAAERIFEEAHSLGLRDQEIIADCTGGPRSMTLGIFLACLDGKRDIQFMGTHYGKDGKPGGPTTPMITKFSVKTIEKAGQ